jgi:nitroreductase
MDLEGSVDVSDIDLRSVDHVLTTTRAVRRRLDFGRPVERELIERCIDIAIQAPTALQGETWHFVVITEQSQRAAVAQSIGAPVRDTVLERCRWIRIWRACGQKSRTPRALPPNSGCSVQAPISSDTCRTFQFLFWRVSKVGSRTPVRVPKHLFTDPSSLRSGL